MANIAFRPPFRFSRVNDNENIGIQSDIVPEVNVQSSNSVIRGLSGASFRMSTRDGTHPGPNSGEIGSITIRDCSDTEFIIDEPIQLLHVYNVVGCSICIHGVRGSVHVSHSSRTSIRGYCSQMRLTDCDDIEVRVQTFSSTALVNSRNIKVGPPPEISAEPSRGNRTLESLGFNKREFLVSDRWKNVKDFECLSVLSPNWSFVS